MKIYCNKNFTKRACYVCTIVVAAVVRGDDPLYRNATPRGGDWEEVSDPEFLDGLELLERSAGVEYWGYL